MNIGSVLNRLSPVKGKYRPINYEYMWAFYHGKGDARGLPTRTPTQNNRFAKNYKLLVQLLL